MELNPATAMDLLATVLFGLAILHTFVVKRFEHLALKYPSGSIGENFFHVLGEVEVVFGLWAGVFVLGFMALNGVDKAVHYVEGLNFREPAFVFVIMTIAATRPVIIAARSMIQSLARLLPLPQEISFYLVTLILGPLLGSFITEPAAMTVSALLLRERLFERGISERLKYATLAVLFVNVSIGGTLTHFAAPPVLMVADAWDWGMVHMLTHFGWKSALAVVLNAVGAAFLFRRELAGLPTGTAASEPGPAGAPAWIITVHLGFLALVVVSAHHTALFMGVFLFFLGVADVTDEYQDRIALREALLVAFFLAGLVVLGTPQDWWLSPLLQSLNELSLFVGATALTAITDNAALTYLGSRVRSLPEELKYSLVAGAVAGGGLTVIANAPNPAGYGILKSCFGEEGISPLTLLLAALPPTLIAVICLWFLPTIS